MNKRLVNFDYRSNCLYYVTLITQRKKNYFGKIVNNNFESNIAGEITQKIWSKRLAIHPYLHCQKLVVMPNHIHILLEYHAMELGNSQQIISLPKLISQFKSESTIVIRRSGEFDFAWQSSFFDHIVRNHYDHQEILSQLSSEISNWKHDKLFMPN